jgi:hypothetical protein
MQGPLLLCRGVVWKLRMPLRGHCRWSLLIFILKQRQEPEKTDSARMSALHQRCKDGQKQKRPSFMGG